MSVGVARVVVADDEPLARERLRRVLRGDRTVRIVGEAASGPEALALIRREKPHIAVLDIRLPGIDAFGVLQHLDRECPPAVIFVTAFGDHALEAFRAGATDYLLKPFEPQRLKEALRRARDRCAGRLLPLPLPPPVPLEPGTPDRFSIRSQGRIILLELKEVEHIKAANSRCRVFTRSASYLVSDSLRAVAARLPADRFVRVSRFAVVNVGAIVSLRTKSHGDQVIELRSGVALTVARTQRRKLVERLEGRKPPTGSD